MPSSALPFTKMPAPNIRSRYGVLGRVATKLACKEAKNSCKDKVVDGTEWRIPRWHLSCYPTRSMRQIPKAVQN